MNNQKLLANNLSLFNNRTFTKKQWEIIFKGCGCPKSTYFWKALRDNNMEKYQLSYTLRDINTESFNKVWEEYCNYNRNSVKKHYDKVKALQSAREKVNKLKGHTFYIIGGILTTEKPERDL